MPEVFLTPVSSFSIGDFWAAGSGTVFTGFDLEQRTMYILDKKCKTEATNWRKKMYKKMVFKYKYHISFYMNIFSNKNRIHIRYFLAEPDPYPGKKIRILTIGF